MSIVMQMQIATPMTLKTTNGASIAPADAPDMSWHVLEHARPFSASLLWQLQRRYFSERGASAWRQGEVPHYITSNPTIAQAYAETVFAFYQDRQRLAPAAEPLTICELGAGSGRFAFHFLRHLAHLCASTTVPLTEFRYVLTDFTQSNLDAWRNHPRFQAWIDAGLLDMALFDVNRPDTLTLQIEGSSLATDSLQHPLVAIANYVFDGVPQELFYFQDGSSYGCEMALLTQGDPSDMDVTTLLDQVQPHYTYAPLSVAPCTEAAAQALFEHYRTTLARAHVLFPLAAWRCLTLLHSFSRGGLLLLSADKGQCRQEAIALSAPPSMARHGSFSLSVNYHALLSCAESVGALGLRPPHPHRSLAIIALLLVPAPTQHVATCAAYQRHLAEFGPDDFYTLASFLARGMHNMGIAEVLAYMRFNRFDAHQLARMMPRLKQLAPELGSGHFHDLKKMFERCWEGYFPLGEENDLAFDIACLLYEQNDFLGALTYFVRTEDIYGCNPGVLYNMAACHQQLGQYRQARALLEQVLQLTPDNEGARTLLADLQEDAAPDV
ncbi:tetratricopeptide repeat protein [Herbaspirillum chlorophenolicum]|uniref:tetratricopeptide repeat protein n=1 Tax=Herbaspirillum chlorophenolicum TaxID=211589 RepID=UPI000B14AFF3|nr:SAM-dependent methyltransferase [Herbaspirillum chlorophenolicum]